MGASTKPILRPYLHHVVRKGDKFICAVCNSTYETLGKAESCLLSCWREAKSASYLQPVRAFGKLRFRCPLCMRMHDAKNLGLECLKACAKSMKPHLSLVSLEDLPEPREKKVFPKFQRPTFIRKMPAASIAEENKTSTPSQAPEAVSTSQLAPAETPSASATPPSGDAPAPRKQRDRTKKFSRDNAKYLCYECKKVYFTKKEAEDCFDSHD